MRQVLLMKHVALMLWLALSPGLCLAIDQSVENNVKKDHYLRGYLA